MNLQTSAELVAFCQALVGSDLEIFQARFRTQGRGYHFEIELDGKGSPPARVSLAACEEVSKKFTQELDLLLEAGEVLPEDLTLENYSLEVSSAGAERELRLPEELERFSGQPLKIKYRQGEESGVRLGTYAGRDDDAILFQEYIRKKERRNKKAGNFSILQGDILRINLYLDL